MKIRSIQVSQRVFLASVIVLSLFTGANIYFNTVIGGAEERYQRILRLQKTFADMLAIETAVLGDGEHYAHLLTADMDLTREIAAEPEYLDTLLLKERDKVFSILLATVSENRTFYADVRHTLPRLIDNVRHIHGYHLENLKMANDRADVGWVQPLTKGFHRSPVSKAPELDIINEAVEVQNCLLDVVAVFYEMQLSVSPDTIEDLFRSRMDKFDDAVNRFEDYSLDAQDGLLVEELLLTGKHFKQAFGKLLQNTGKAKILKKKLSDNQQQVSVMFETAAHQLKSSKQKLQRRFDILQNISIVVLVALCCWLISYGIRLSAAFTRTLHETQKIRSDLTYRIPDNIGGYQEFDTLFQTLNLLAETTDRQVKSLERMQRELGQRVQERTAELVHMNTRLKNEAADRLKADESRKELEAQLIRAKKMEAVGTLAGGVAHDLNNILSGVVTYPELLLLDMRDDDPLYEPLRNIKHSGERAALIVQDLLTLARRGVAVTEVVDIREMVNGYLQSPEFGTLRRANPDVELRYDLAESTGNVIGSRLHLLKAMMNIVINGMEAMPDGGVLTVKTRAVYVDTAVKGYETVQEGDYVCFSVTDTGVGMTTEVTEQIFEPFFTRKQMGRSGTGLGMAVVYGTVKDHGGYIDIDTTPGKGTTISVYFPLTREEHALHEPEAELSSLVGTNQHVLIVDDVYEQRQLASAMLQRLNYTVATAAGGEEAVAYVRDNDVDLVLLDMIMPPGMDGLDTFLALKAVAPEVRVIIASGYSENSRVHRARNLGAGTYIKKPYSIEVLGRAVGEALSTAG